MDDVDRVFQVVKPICVRVVKETNLENLKALQNLLSIISPLHMDCLAEYLLFPVRFVLKQPSVLTNEDLVRLDLKCLELIVSGSTDFKRWETFVDLFSLLLCLLDKPGVEKLFSQLNESFILQCIEIFNLILAKISEALWLEVRIE